MDNLLTVLFKEYIRMIWFVRGVLKNKEEGFVIIDVNGIGLGMETPTTLASELPDTGEEVELYTYLRFSEDGLSLFGFGSNKERDVFELLVKTSGIGPRLGIAILSALPLDEFVQGVIDKNIPTLTKIPGIGKKKAEKIIVELKDKISLFATALTGEPSKQEPQISEDQRMRINDAIEALIALGMKANEATKAIYGAYKELGPDITTTDLIKRGLKYK